ncbi:hypothetical protein ZYGR_0W00130 [Zygosaccharomyces rouxii]|uniref:ZYRO0F16500p n=2 Tax=Zygosaccharomyces rouxii TaxID=4956 RepID=C5DYX4_ZYGRC|nr:uncharacterized protein ZYRO0F16500g [Zygosaccharomyces rouxii]KAH9201303.1 hypothetical protein LQ764DRAFT_78062 [Zygosaccharomyces rouxii]GAV50487.1 hypothetical protein ZYGR_0W00130 [Zygosaccharomyces rouxii]CAQ43389.1 Uncharacterized membrane protein YGL140C [Zygosaccharomyces rouxii]CAR28985.1 ZYRO0F16500p [Zygosaccharomyces rouxii]
MKETMNTRAKRLQRWWLRHFPIDRVLAQKVFKCTVNSTVAFIFCLIPEVRKHLGAQPAMLPLISVMAHPGRRISGTIQAMMFCLTGLVLGLSYALFGRFLAQRCLGHNWKHLTEDEQYANHFVRYESALAVLAVFETFMLFFHGWMRSLSHHYFAMVFPLFLVVHFAFLDPLDDPISATTKAYTVPFYLGIAMSLFFNLVLFPEFGSTYLGNTTIDTMNLIHKAIDDSVNFFISIDLKESQSLYRKSPESLSKLLKSKPTIHNKVSTCSTVLHECIYEISYSYVSPTQLKPIIETFKSCSMYINGLINACQLEFTLLSRDENREGDLLQIKTDKEIAYAHFERFDRVLRKLRPSIYNLHKILSESVYLTKILLAHAYDVDLSRAKGSEIFKDSDEIVRYKNKKDLPTDFCIDERKNTLQKALLDFDREFREELLKSEIDFLRPKDEMFLLSSFLMNFKETTNFVINLLDHSKEVHTTRSAREAKGWLRGKSVWFTFLHSFQSFKIWIRGTYSKTNPINENEGLQGGISTQQNKSIGAVATRRPSVAEEDLLLQQAESDKNLRDLKETAELPLPATLSSNLESDNSYPFKKKEGTTFESLNYYFTACFIKTNRFLKRSKAHFRFGFQVAIALMLASFPMFVPKTRDWYVKFHGAWVGFVCILCVEPSVGDTFWSFFLRMLGVVIGSSWAYLSYAAGQHQSDPYLETVITAIGAAPGFYYFLGTPYVKAAIIGIISIYIVLLAAAIPSSIHDTILTAWAKRCFAVGYGGGVALIVQLIMFPSKARDELNQEIAFVCGSISELQLLYASGLEGEPLKVSLSEQKYKRMAKVSQSARAALSRADAYKGLARQEPRLKGEYTELGKVFTQVIFILRQILDRIDNAALLRKQNGSAIIEELNSVVYPYRRQIIASLCCLMRAIQEAFLNKTPLPQFLPSPRIAQRRLINMVRRALRENYSGQLSNGNPISKSSETQDNDINDEHEIMINFKRQNESEKTRHATYIHEFALKERFLTWNASTVSFEEIIEYVEELCNLTKILVGVNEFKYGFLSRPLYEDWAAEAATGFDDFIQGKRPKKQQRPPSSREPDISESVASSAASSLSGGEQDPVALQPDDSEPPLNLARIASHKAGNNTGGLPGSFRKRAFSIGFVSDQVSGPNGLSKHKTLGDTDSDIEDDEDTSDDELPLALKKILTGNKTKNE